MFNIELPKMCMLKKQNDVLMINRLHHWPGWAFPGGHLEYGESVTQCIIREFHEETGLWISELQYKGMADIFNSETNDRHIIHNFVAKDYRGELKRQGYEGEVRWVDLDMIRNLPLAEGMEYRIPLFIGTHPQELYIEWDSTRNYTKVVYYPEV